MPQLIILLILVIVIVPLVVAKLVLDYRSKHRGRSGDVTLTVEELEKLVRQYVEEATTPLRQRIRELEQLHENDEKESGTGTHPADHSLIDDPSLDDDLRVDDPESESSDNLT